MAKELEYTDLKEFEGRTIEWWTNDACGGGPFKGKIVNPRFQKGKLTWDGYSGDYFDLQNFHPSQGAKLVFIARDGQQTSVFCGIPGSCPFNIYDIELNVLVDEDIYRRNFKWAAMNEDNVRENIKKKFFNVIGDPKISLFV